MPIHIPSKLFGYAFYREQSGNWPSEHSIFISVLVWGGNGNLCAVMVAAKAWAWFWPMCHGPPWQQPERASCIGPVVTAQYPTPRNSRRTDHLLRDLELAY
jgi:hypothetical protein